jgi:hypothetical protein
LQPFNFSVFSSKQFGCEKGASQAPFQAWVAQLSSDFNKLFAAFGHSFDQIVGGVGTAFDDRVSDATGLG